MSIVKATGVIGSFLTWVAVEGLLLRFAPARCLCRTVVGNLMAVTVLCFAWHGFSWTCLSEIVFLTTMGVTFRRTTEHVNESFGGKKGLALGFLAGHLAAFGVALVWYVLALIYLAVFG